MRGLGIGLVFGVLVVLATIDARAGEAAPAPRVTVRRAQELLARMGYRPGKVDGINGPRTTRALKSFQRAEELVTSGRLDRPTRDVLRQMLAVAAVPATKVAEALQATDELLGEADWEGDERPVDALFAATESGDARDRVDAVGLLAQVHSPRARACLGLVLFGNDLPAARVEAARALARLADPVSLYALALSYDGETDPGVRQAIEEGLEEALPKELPPRGRIVAAR